MMNLIDQWQKENRAFRVEGATGVRNFQSLCEAIGYKEGEFLGSDVAIINFLADNSGAIEALIEWIGEQNVEDWKESIKSKLKNPPEEEEEEA